MTGKLLVLAAITLAFGAASASAQTRARTYWPPGLEQQERAVTRDLNNQQADQPTQYAYPQQYSYVPAPRPYQPYPPQYSYSPAPAYAYPYDYPPRPFYSRYY